MKSALAAPGILHTDHAVEQFSRCTDIEQRLIALLDQLPEQQRIDLLTGIADHYKVRIGSYYRSWDD